MSKEQICSNDVFLLSMQQGILFIFDKSAKGTYFVNRKLCFLL